MKCEFILDQHYFTYFKCIPASIYANFVFPECFLSFLKVLNSTDVNDVCIFKVGMAYYYILYILLYYYNCFINIAKLAMHVNYLALQYNVL